MIKPPNPYLDGGDPFMSPRLRMLRAVEAMRSAREIDVTSMNDLGQTVIRQSWTPLKGWKQEVRVYPFPEPRS